MNAPTTSTMPPILIDSREQHPLTFSTMATESVGLFCGDYSLLGFEPGTGTPTVAVERKSLPDLLACAGRDRERFMQQWSRLNALGAGNAFVLIEATPRQVLHDPARSQMGRVAVLNTLLSWQVRFPAVKVLQTEREGAAYLTFRLLWHWWRLVGRPSQEDNARTPHHQSRKGYRPTDER